MNSWHGDFPFSPLWFVGLGAIGIALIAALALAAIALKGYALWHAAKRDEKGWFVALLIINTMGILELAYLYFVVKKWNKKAHHAQTHTGHHTHSPASEPK